MGKSTLAKLATDRPIIGSDDYRALGDGLGSPEAPLAMIRDTARLESFVAEGVLVARALRGPTVNGRRVPGMAVDAVVYLQRPKVHERLGGQVSMAKAVRTIFDEWHRRNRHVPVFFEGVRA